MHFVVIAYDGTDEGALARRMAVRETHLKMGKELADNGNWLCACAMQNDEGKSIGSVMICDFPSRDELDEWLKKEPYAQGEVWKEIRVYPALIPPLWAQK
jgi:uncharacterized protein